MSRPIRPIPAKGTLAIRRLTNRRVAEALDYTEHYVCRVLNGRQPASEEFRRRLSELLQMPEAECFGHVTDREHVA